jgi:hypothetical protein
MFASNSGAMITGVTYNTLTSTTTIHLNKQIQIYKNKPGNWLGTMTNAIGVAH